MSTFDRVLLVLFVLVCTLGSFFYTNSRVNELRCELKDGIILQGVCVSKEYVK